MPQWMKGAFPALALLTSGAFAQEFQHVFHAPAEMLCVIDVVGTSTQANEVTLEGYLADGTLLRGQRAIDLSAGKAVELRAFDELGDAAALLIVKTTGPSVANITCRQATGTVTVPVDENTVWSYLLVTEYTMRGQDFPTKTFVSSIGVPAAVFSPDEQWTNLVYQYNPTASEMTNVVTMPTTSTAQYDRDGNPPKTTPIVQESALGSGQGSMLDLAQLALQTPIREVPKDVAITGVAVYATQLLSNGKMTVPQQAPGEFADVVNMFPHVFVPTDPAGWQEALSLTNGSSVDVTAILQPYDAAGRLMDYVVKTIPANTTLTALTQDLFKDVTSTEKIASLQVRSMKALSGQILFQFGDSITSMPAAPRIDAGATLMDPSVRVGENSITSYAIANAGGREETVLAETYRADGSVAQQATFTLAPHARIAESIADLFGADPADMSDVAYTKFSVTTPSDTAATTTDPYNRVGRIAALAITGSDGALSGSALTNVDPVQEQHFSDAYNPLQNKELPKFNGGTHKFTATVRSNTSVDSMSLNPRGDNNLSGSYSVTWKNSTPSRLLHSTVESQGAPTFSGYIPETRAAYAGQLTPNVLPTDIATGERVDTTFTPTATLKQNGIATTWKEPLTIFYEKNNSMIGDAAYNAIKNNVDAIARVFWEHNDAIVGTKKAYYEWQNSFAALVNDNYPQLRVKNFDVFDDRTNSFAFTQMRTPDGYFMNVDFDNSPSAEQAIDALKRIFGMGISSLPKDGTYKH